MKYFKTYADKGVQIDSHVDKSLLTSSCSDVPYIQRVLDDPQSSDFCSPSHFSNRSSAYIDSDASLSDRSCHVLKCHTINNQRPLKYGHLGCGRPHHLAFTNDRIVSLPETSPPCRITQSPRRLVSMPESLKMLRYSHDHLQPLLGSEPSDISLASNGTTQKNSFQGEHVFLGGIPQTPSPPSSPESVVIIGNEDQVPRAFLRSKSTVDDTDLHGMCWDFTLCQWSRILSRLDTVERLSPQTHTRVAWAVVFALRPLSLVSIALFTSALKFIRIRGAEGTVIEGEDLTHMIWGLDSNSPQLVQSSHQSSGQVCKSLLQPTSSSRDSKETPFQDHIVQNLYNRDVIDLSLPELQAPSGRVNDIQFARPARTYLSPVEDLRRDQINDIQSKKTNKHELTRRDSPIQLYPYSFRLLPEAKSCNAGLGIDLWHGNLRSGTFGATFVSRDAKDSSLVLSQPPRTIYPTHIYQTQPSLPVRDTRTFEYIGSHPGIPTPPDTSSPQWSPRFQHSHITGISPEINHPANVSQYPVQYSTRDTLVSSQQVQPQVLLRNLEHCSASPDYLEVMRRLPPCPYPDNVGADRFSSDSHNGDTQSPPKHRFSQDKSKITPLSPVSPEVRRGLVQHQPRSIPLARLIQRRLSSVVEEEIAENSSCDIHRPLTSSPPSGKQGSGCPNLNDDSHKEDKTRVLMPGRKATIIASSAAGPTDDHVKRAYKPSRRPSRRAPTGPQDASTKLQIPPTKVDQPAMPAYRAEGNKENATSAQKNVSKSKKKKYPKKQDLVSPAAKN